MAKWDKWKLYTIGKLKNIVNFMFLNQWIFFLLNIFQFSLHFVFDVFHTRSWCCSCYSRVIPVAAQVLWWKDFSKQLLNSVYRRLEENLVIKGNAEVPLSLSRTPSSLGSSLFPSITADSEMQTNLRHFLSDAGKMHSRNSTENRIAFDYIIDDNVLCFELTTNEQNGCSMHCHTNEFFHLFLFHAEPNTVQNLNESQIVFCFWSFSSRNRRIMWFPFSLLNIWRNRKSIWKWKRKKTKEKLISTTSRSSEIPLTSLHLWNCYTLLGGIHLIFQCQQPSSSVLG